MTQNNFFRRVITDQATITISSTSSSLKQSSSLSSASSAATSFGPTEVSRVDLARIRKHQTLWAVYVRGWREARAAVPQSPASPADWQAATAGGPDRRRHADRKARRSDPTKETEQRSRARTRSQKSKSSVSSWSPVETFYEDKDVQGWVDSLEPSAAQQMGPEDEIGSVADGCSGIVAIPKTLEEIVDAGRSPPKNMCFQGMSTAEIVQLLVELD